MSRLAFSLVLLALAATLAWRWQPERSAARPERAAASTLPAVEPPVQHWSLPVAEPASAMPRPFPVLSPSSVVDRLFGAPRHTPVRITLTEFYDGLASADSNIRTVAAEDPGDLSAGHGIQPVAAIAGDGPALPGASSGETAIFNGSDLTGWTVQDGALDAWSVDSGVLRCTRAGGGWLRTVAEYANFELNFQYRLAPGANTGVALRFPEAGSPTLAGIEVQLIDDAHPKYATLRPDQYTGSLYYLAPPQTRLTLAAGEWHACRIRAIGSRIEVAINGQTVNDVDLGDVGARATDSSSPPRPPLGLIGFQSSAPLVEFRDIRLRNLLKTLPEGVQFTDLAVGDGALCTTGATVTVDYRGCLLDGREFDNSADRGAPVTVALDQVIAGWRLGIPGMRVGGRRQLIVPADLAYGKEGVAELIPPSATLVFEVELRGVEH